MTRASSALHARRQVHDQHLPVLRINTGPSVDGERGAELLHWHMLSVSPPKRYTVLAAVQSSIFDSAVTDLRLESSQLHVRRDRLSLAPDDPRSVYSIIIPVVITDIAVASWFPGGLASLISRKASLAIHLRLLTSRHSTP